MPAPGPLVDLSRIDLSVVVADAAAIAASLPHRHEMAQLTAISYMDPAEQVIVGYKDVTADEFWVRGHFPDHPVFPGVLMCETAAQLCGYFTNELKVSGGALMGLGGLDDVGFRRMVRPGDRLVFVAKAVKLNRRMTVYDVQGFVGGELACHMRVKGVALGRVEDL